jgi:hypothetical protein
MSGNPNYPYSYSLKTLPFSYSFLIWMSDGCIRIRFSILSEFDIIRIIRQKSDIQYPTLFVSAKIKYP